MRKCSGADASFRLLETTASICRMHVPPPRLRHALAGMRRKCEGHAIRFWKCALAIGSATATVALVPNLLQFACSESTAETIISLSTLDFRNFTSSHIQTQLRSQLSFCLRSIFCLFVCWNTNWWQYISTSFDSMDFEKSKLKCQFFLRLSDVLITLKVDSYNLIWLFSFKYIFYPQYCNFIIFYVAIYCYGKKNFGYIKFTSEIVMYALQPIFLHLLYLQYRY